MSTARLDITPQERARLARLAHFSENNNGTADTNNASERSTPRQTAPLRTRPLHTLTAEERIERCVSKLKGSCTALDILVASFTKVSQNPTTERFRKVDLNANGPFKREVASVAGGIELLYAVGFEPLYGHLVLQKHDAALLKKALDALEAARSSDEYKGSRALKADAAARAASAARAEEEASAQRAASLAKVPKEPAAEDSTSFCQLSFQMGESEKAFDVIGRRRFDSENVLADVYNFCRSLPKVPTGGSLTLENVTTRPPKLLDMKRQRSTSLYALDLWPIGKVRVTWHDQEVERATPAEVRAAA